MSVEEKVFEAGVYRHYKGGEYELLFTARHSETGELMVVYRALYEGGETWVRPARMWNETVQTAQGEVTRFTRVNG